ncbi:D-Ala-D-Ala carboxypeptidase family metallohydrolase [Bergeriella denitrificans]|uniref:Putative phage associated protein n=1 Tax=Bergeriella denitrificans TaxID=494 RepID=A0A378UJ15_BERDE|nr:D-Ala-D-Ala carboxypeptidase family metallohydrolase [Bergeriella denitrificans]STZ77336.1 putative phage associated protein [Bergeriella denitrificans]STZ83009.1 putative phage associated protein [Bergeriella denitrificans]
MQITEHFSLAELTRSDTAKRRGLNNTPNANELANIKKTAAELEKIRAYVEAPIVVSSCFRSAAVNRAVGGSSTSAHRYGSAADIDAVGYTSPELARKILEMRDKGLIKFDQLILEFPERGAGAWVHIGFRWNSGMRNQVLTAKTVKGRTVYVAGLQS